MPARDLEFVQFHPTVMWRGPDATGQQPLVSEAVRGEGAILFDAAGERVMTGVHPLEDLAPRDVVAAAISRRMAEAPGGVDDHVYLDATAMGERFYTRFPSITAACRKIGIDPARDRIPVAPAAHFACGGGPVGARVERRAEAHQVADRRRRLGDELAHDGLVAQPGAGGERVAHVLLEGVGGVEDARQAALRPRRRAGVEDVLGDDEHAAHGPHREGRGEAGRP